MNSTPTTRSEFVSSPRSLASVGLSVLAHAALALGGRALLRRIFTPLDGAGLPSGA